MSPATPTLRETFPAIPTSEIEPPVVEEVAGKGETVLPRVLLEIAGAGRAARRVLALAGLFAMVALLEIAILLNLPPAGTVVVYGESHEVRKMEKTCP